MGVPSRYSQATLDAILPHDRLLRSVEFLGREVTLDPCNRVLD